MINNNLLAIEYRVVPIILEKCRLDTWKDLCSEGTRSWRACKFKTKYKTNSNLKMDLYYV